MRDQSQRAIDIRKLTENLSRIILRMVPILPGPEIYDLLKDLGKSRVGLDQKITRAQASLTEASDLIREMETDMNARAEKLTQLREEYEKYSKLSEIEEGKARGIMQQIETVIGRHRGRERMIALLLNLLAGIVVFVLGVILGPPLMRWLVIGQ
jgi:hypothetical protein